MSCRRDRPRWIFTDFLDEKAQALQNHGEFVKAMGTITKDDGSTVNFTAWFIKAKKPMRLISTSHNSSVVETEEETRGESGDNVRIRCVIPRARQDYKIRGGFVDRANAGIMVGRFRHRLYRWRNSLLLWYLKLVVHNSWVLYQAIRGIRISENDYIRALARDLSPVTPMDNDLNHHLPLAHLANKEEEHCKLCLWWNHKHSSTPYFCRECNAAIHTGTRKRNMCNSTPAIST